MRHLSAALPLIFSVVSAATLLAQPSDRDRLIVTAAAEGGAYPRVENPHIVYGGSVQLRYNAFGVVAIGLAGESDDYQSQMGVGALMMRVYRTGALNAGILAGYGHYKEEGWSGIERAAPGFVLGATLFIDRGLLAARITAFDFRGRYDGPDVLAPFSFSAPRITIGLGFNVVP